MNCMRELNAGIVAIISLLFATIVSSILRVNYNHFKEAFSELGKLNSPYYIFFNFFAFIVPGSLLFYSLRNIDLKLGIDNVLSFKVASIGWILTGLFPLSYSIVWLYWIHIFGAIIAFIFGPLGIILLSSQLSSRVEWTYFSFFSTIIAFMTWTSILLFDLYLHNATAQLISIGLFFLWYLLFLIKIQMLQTSSIKQSIIFKVN